jgi:sulfite reductase (NADPH) flavoprotein alpha-component
MSIPILPESAPFSAEQRSWLNGFFAGLLGLDPASNGVGHLSPATALAAAMSSNGNGNGNGHASATATVEQEEDFPWHDPAMPMDERLGLAEGKPIERKLMAAMAQLDCGACGYLCKTYSEAIASGEEKCLTKCTPGGKETARKLKELVAAGGAGTATTNGAPRTTAGSNGAAKTSARAAASAYHRTNPFPARLIECRPLNGTGSAKDTRHIAIDLAGSGLTYTPGDALGVYPKNCPGLVDELLRALAIEDRLDLRASLLGECALGRPGDDLLERLVEWAVDPEEADRLSQLRDSEDEWIETADILDVLLRHRSVRPDVEEFVSLLPRLQPRLYSISSSLRAHPDEVHLTVGVVRYTKESRVRKGVASTHLGERLRLGDEVRVFIHPSHRFQLPDQGDTPMIMVGPGTGVAPFRAFLEERQAAGAQGKNWLFFGDQCRATDYLYEEELHKAQQGGLLTRLDLAFSRDQAEKIYVQDRMRERGKELWGWLDEGAHFYVCGDAKRMASDVDRALHQVVVDHGGLSAQDAKAYVANLTKTGRYQRDVY